MVEPASTPTGERFTVSDGVGIVAGAAVAAVHLRLVTELESLGGGDGSWVLIWSAFAWLAITAAGPFLFIIRRYGRRTMRQPGVGEWLWALLGTPWLLGALAQPSPGPESIGPGPMFVMGLLLGLGIACLLALIIVWITWVAVPADRAARNFEGPWTNRVGLALAIAWPVQCGLGMVVLG